MLTLSVFMMLCFSGKNIGDENTGDVRAEIASRKGPFMKPRQSGTKIDHYGFTMRLIRVAIWRRGESDKRGKGRLQSSDLVPRQPTAEDWIHNTPDTLLPFDQIELLELLLPILNPA